MGARRTRSVTIRLTEREFAYLLESAGNISLSSYIRIRLLRKATPDYAAKSLSEASAAVLTARKALKEVDERIARLDADIQSR